METLMKRLERGGDEGGRGIFGVVKKVPVPFFVGGPEAMGRGERAGRGRRVGFTLIEVLVVITVIVVLVAMLMPSLSNARKYAMQVRCASNLRQIGIGNGTYMSDYREWILGFTDPSGIEPLLASTATNTTKQQWQTYWPTQVRWCPDLTSDLDLLDGGPGGWAPAYGTRDNANQNLRTRFGYVMPALSEFALDNYGYHQTRRGGAGEQNFYVRPEFEGLASSFTVSPRVYDSKNWTYRRTLPYAFDMVWQNNKTSPTRFVIAHDSDGDNIDSFWRVRPYGGNALWADGSAKWFSFVQTNASQGDYRDVAVGAVVGTVQKLREDWCRMDDARNFFLVARRGR
jgi:prepilin-type N-terminal cleavage/methylation domain-containing protein